MSKAEKRHPATRSAVAPPWESHSHCPRPGCTSARRHIHTPRHVSTTAVTTNKHGTSAEAEETDYCTLEALTSKRQLYLESANAESTPVPQKRQPREGYSTLKALVPRREYYCTLKAPAPRRLLYLQKRQRLEGYCTFKAVLLRREHICTLQASALGRILHLKSTNGEDYYTLKEPTQRRRRAALPHEALPTALLLCRTKPGPTWYTTRRRGGGGIQMLMRFELSSERELRLKRMNKEKHDHCMYTGQVEAAAGLQYFGFLMCQEWIKVECSSNSQK